MSVSIEDKKAVKDFYARKKKNSKKERKNNSALYAGSPMYYYCSYCGDEDVKSECFNPRINPIKDPCDACKELIKKGLMPEK